MKEQPIRVIPQRGYHKMETRVFAREIHELFCVQPGCQFRGKHAQQGVCHTTTPFGEGSDWSYVEAMEKIGRDFIRELREVCKRGNRDYAERLEGQVFCNWLAFTFQSDQLVCLRRDNALLKNKIERLTKKILRKKRSSR